VVPLVNQFRDKHDAFLRGNARCVTQGELFRVDAAKPGETSPLGGGRVKSGDDYTTYRETILRPFSANAKIIFIR
jgi:hypothetical protein